MRPRLPITRPHERTFKPDSTAGRLLAYFERQPDEDLTLRDAATKLDASMGTVYEAVRTLRLAGRVEVVTVVRPRRSA